MDQLKIDETNGFFLLKEIVFVNMGIKYVILFFFPNL